MQEVAILFVKLDHPDHKGKYVIDWKTSNSLQDKHFYQVAAYQRCIDPTAKAAIVHLGNRTQKKYSFKTFDVNEAWKFFQHYNKTFQMNFPNAMPTISEYPKRFTLSSTPAPGKDL